MSTFAAATTRTITTTATNLANLAKGGSFGSAPKVTYLVRNIGSDDLYFTFSDDGGSSFANGGFTLAAGEFICLPCPSGTTPFVAAKNSSTDIELVALL